MAFESEGFNCIFSNEFDKHASVTYAANFEMPNTGNLIDLVSEPGMPAIPKNFNILVGGFPCQPFSVAGHKKGFEDPNRGNLLHHVVEILKERKPEAFFLENVKHLKYHDKERTFAKVLDLLQDINGERYFVKYEVMNSKDYGGVPQNRERIYIVGFRSEEAYNKFKFPPKIPLNRTFHALLENDVQEHFYYHPEKTLIYPKLKDAVVKKNTIYQYRRYYIRENKSGLCPTLTANMGLGGHNVPIILDDSGIRKLTPRECARMQGFPEGFVFPDGIPMSAMYKQMGNSVTIPVIRSIAKEMRIALA